MTSWKSAERINSVQTPVVPLVGEWIRQHPGTISLGQGIVHYPPPKEVGAAVAAASADGAVSRYCAVQGIPDFVDEARRKVQTENGIPLHGMSIVATAGSNMGFFNALVAIGDPGDEIILVSPYYFNHEMAVNIAGCVPVIVPTERDGTLSPATLGEAVTARTKAIVTVSPNNPTGVVYTRETLTAVNQLCREQGLFHISDEAYEYFVYDGEHFSPASLPGAGEHTISLFTLSKAYGMAGWRVAYMVLPEALELAVKKTQDTNLVCPSVISQVAGAAAMRAGRGWCLEQAKGFADIRDMVLEELAALGERVVVPRPSGAFYAIVNTDSQRTDLELVEQMIREFGVATLPGGTFGLDGCAIRVAFGALHRETVAEGMKRLVRALSRLL